MAKNTWVSVESFHPISKYLQLVEASPIIVGLLVICRIYFAPVTPYFRRFIGAGWATHVTSPTLQAYYKAMRSALAASSLVEELQGKLRWKWHFSMFFGKNEFWEEEVDDDWWYMIDSWWWLMIAMILMIDDLWWGGSRLKEKHLTR